MFPICIWPCAWPNDVIEIQIQLNNNAANTTSLKIKGVVRKLYIFQLKIKIN